MPKKKQHLLTWTMRLTKAQKKKIKWAARVNKVSEAEIVGSLINTIEVQ